MMGVNNGAAAELKQLCISLLSQSGVQLTDLELSALGSIESVPLLAELKETLNGVYKQHSHSAQAPRAAPCNGGVDVVKRVSHTYPKSLEGFAKNFKVTLVHFEN